MLEEPRASGVRHFARPRLMNPRREKNVQLRRRPRTWFAKLSGFSEWTNQRRDQSGLVSWVLVDERSTRKNATTAGPGSDTDSAESDGEASRRRGLSRRSTRASGGVAIRQAAEMGR